MAQKRYKFVYDEINRRHTLGGMPIPSVTDVLPRIKFNLPDVTMKIKRKNGLDNHSMLKMYLDTRETFGDPLLIKIDSFLKEHKKKLGKLQFYERPLVSREYLFCGRPDMVFENAIVDLKSSNYAPRHFSLQLAGYKILIDENYKYRDRKWIVIYPNDNEIIPVNVYDKMAVQLFFGQVKQWHFNKTVNLFLKGA